jgi:uncharacterized membrane-anchored protein YitT (DUF2179 family)
VNVILAALLAAVPNAFMAVLSRFVTEKFMTMIVAKVTIAGLQWAKDKTTNTIDDEIVEDVTKRLQELT